MSKDYQTFKQQSAIYKGIKYRSRLHARWAIYLEAVLREFDKESISIRLAREFQVGYRSHQFEIDGSSFSPTFTITQNDKKDTHIIVRLKRPMPGKGFLTHMKQLLIHFSSDEWLIAHGTFYFQDRISLISLNTMTEKPLEIWQKKFFNIESSQPLRTVRDFQL